MSVNNGSPEARVVEVLPYLMIDTTKINEQKIPFVTAVLGLALSFEHGQHLFARCA